MGHSMGGESGKGPSYGETDTSRSWCARYVLEEHGDVQVGIGLLARMVSSTVRSRKAGPQLPSIGTVS